jgi:DNA-binding response OmpR family regulator
VLTVKSDETDIVKALESRADEYIIKPFRPLELLARIKLILRKKYYPQGEQCLNIGRFRFDVTSHKLETENQVINLTSTESLILYHLAMNKGNVLSLSTLAQKSGETIIPELMKQSGYISGISGKKSKTIPINRN